MGWHSVAVVPGCGMRYFAVVLVCGIAFGSSGAGLCDGVLLRWCWVVGWRSIALVLDCGMAFCRGGAWLWDGVL